MSEIVEQTRFERSFTLSDPAPQVESLFSKYALAEKWSNIRAGVYNNGLLTFCDSTNYSFDTLKPYEELVGIDALPAAYTAFGDVFCMCPAYRTYQLLYPASFEVINIGGRFSWFLDRFMCDDELQEELLEGSRFGKACLEHGPLSYGAFYNCHEPQDWLPGSSRGTSVINHLFHLRN